jgi:hypothetical protein
VGPRLRGDDVEFVVSDDVGFAVSDALFSNVIPAQAGTQCTGSSRPRCDRSPSRRSGDVAWFDEQRGKTSR